MSRIKNFFPTLIIN